MKKLRRTLDKINNKLCLIGIHHWVYKKEVIEFIIHRLVRKGKRTIHYRVCTKCYKSQRTRPSFSDGVKWMNETESQMKHRKELIRSIKLDKLIKKIKS